MVEVAISMVLFLSFLAVIFTMAFAVFRYVMLVDTATTMTRRLAVNPYIAGSDCTQIRAALGTQYQNYLVQTFNPTGASTATFVGDLRQVTGGCELSVTAGWTIPCFFCGMFGGAHTITTQATARIDSPDFIACGNGCVTCP